MRKADAACIGRLASGDEAERVAAAQALDALKPWHFEDHPLPAFAHNDPTIDGLVAAGIASPSEDVRAWAAQILAMRDAHTPSAAAVVAAAAGQDLEYSTFIAYYVCNRRDLVPDGLDVARSLHRHPRADVRWTLARQLYFLQPSLDYAHDIAMLRALARDPSKLPRSHAVSAMAGFAELGAADVDVLLDVINIDSGNARRHALDLVAKLAASVPGCEPSHFAPRTPALRFDGVYRTGRHELDVEGHWIGQECLRFFAEGQVALMHTDASHRDFDYLLATGLPERARARYAVDGTRVSFALSIGGSHVGFEGHIDGDSLVLTRINVANGRTEALTYELCAVDWRPPPTASQRRRAERYHAVDARRLEGRVKRDFAFVPPKTQSMTASDASKWYMQMTARIPGLIDAGVGPAERVARAWRLKDAMRAAAASALYDPKLKKRFFDSLPLPSLDDLLASVDAGRGDTPREVAAMQRLLTFTSAEQRAFPGTVGEAIGLQYWDGEQVWEMTEAGWMRLARPGASGA